jgi:hypothetical protein
MNTRLLLSIALVAGFTTAARAQLFRMGATRNLSSVSNIVANGHLSLSGETNRLTVAGGALLLDGSAIGGDTIWNNTDGVIAPASGQDTNVLRFTSGLADNATNAAVVVDTDAEWTGGKLFSLRNNNAEKLAVTSTGGILKGAAVETIWTPTSGMFATALNDASLGEGSKWEFIHGSWETNDWSGAYAYFDTFGDTNRASLDLEAYGNNGDWYYFLVQSAPDAGVLTAALRDSNGPKTLLDPSKAEPGASAAYIFDTISAVASGVISDTKNNGTAKHSIAFDGATTIAQSASEPAAPAAGYFTLFGIDNGSGKMILKVRFPTGASQVIATEP